MILTIQKMIIFILNIYLYMIYFIAVFAVISISQYGGMFNSYYKQKYFS